MRPRRCSREGEAAGRCGRKGASRGGACEPRRETPTVPPVSRLEGDKLLLAVLNDPNRGLDRSERGKIRELLAGAAFSLESRSLGAWARYKTRALLGLPHPSNPALVLTADTELTSLEYHLLKHRLDGSWHQDTTPAEYLAGVRLAATHSQALLHVGRAEFKYPNTSATRALPRAATQTPTNAMPPVPRADLRAGRCIFVVYDPDRSKYVSGYTMDPAEAEEELAKWKGRRKFSP